MLRDLGICIWACGVIGLGWAAPAVAGPQNMIHGQPAFDSGWRDVPGTPLQITHHLGGDVDDYVIDLQLRESTLVEASAGVHISGLGGDRYSSDLADDRGAWLHQVDATDLWVVAGADAVAAEQVRARIWVVPSAEWDSGWRALDAGGELVLTHGLGGDSGEYVVDLMMRSGSTVHQRGLGGDYAPGDESRGAYWFGLTSTGIRLQRMEGDTACPELRVRVFRRPAPDYDSGWQTIGQGTALMLDHDLGGPWNDLFVDLQREDPTWGMGVHNVQAGGDRWSDIMDRGVQWTGLTGSSVRIWRHAQDQFSGRVRLRIWASRAPAWNSGWRAVAQGAGLHLSHDLGGDADAWVVDLQLKDDDASPGSGVSSRGYGGDRYLFSDTYIDLGGAWSGLDSEGIDLFRFSEDSSAEQMRARIWHAAPPDYDSGWTAISPGQTRTLTHDLGVQPVHTVVDLQYRNSLASGVNHAAYGGDTWYDAVSEGHVTHGATWRALDSTSLEVHRYPDDGYAEEVRVRIWITISWDRATTLVGVSHGENVWTHGLGAPPDEMVVYGWAETNDFTSNTHDQMGQDTYTLLNPTRTGWWWQNLGSTTLGAWMAANELEVDDLHVRLWWTGEEATIFRDGFESGNTGQWSTSAP